MENKSDLKAIMACFQANGSSMENSTSTGRPKATLPGQALHTKRPVSERGATVPPKPSFVKNSPTFISDSAGQELSKTKALASMFANSQEDTSFKHKLQSKHSFTQLPEPKSPVNKSVFNTYGADPKPTLPKPVNAPKPPWVKMDTSSTQPPTRTVPPALLKPNNNLFKLQEQMDSNALNIDSVNKPAPPTVPADMSTSKISAAQTLFNKEPAEQDNKMKMKMKPSAVSPPLQPSHSVPPPKPLASKKPSLKKPSAMMKDPSAPKRNPLLNSLALGPAPAKPNRPPHVDLQVYKRKLLSPATDPEKSIASPPPSSNHSNHVTLAPPPVPSLPPRHPGARNENEELYDDVDGLSSAPPPLPPVHPNQVSKEKDNDDEDGEMYEYLDERWEAAEPQQETRKVKDDKEGKKQVEAGKKEQKDREKKEQEARKKFKLVGSLDVLQKGKAVVDIKGSKTDLSLKQGDSLDIIRIHGNPEGKWLGRSQDGSIGYVKITSVKIDINVLKQQAAEQAYEPDIYDDIEMAAPETSTTKEPELVPPPLPETEEIYDDVDAIADISPSEPWQSPKKPRVFHWMLERGRGAPSIKVLPTSGPNSGNTDKEGAAVEEIYDDVDSQNVPPPPPAIVKPRVDPKKLKKMEKEEKEFRKKFKYEGEIEVLHQLIIIPNLTNKKWSNKELPLKAGEKLDVIVRAADNKFICRNEDGKFGYVSTSYVVTDDGDIYDDIGDECIYDND